MHVLGMVFYAAAAGDHRAGGGQPARPARPVPVHPAGQGHAGDLGRPRAGAQRRDPHYRVVGAAWLLSGLLAGLAGVALAMDLGTFDFNIGGSFLLIIVAAAVFGSVGEPYGAMVGALVIGIASELAAIVNPDLKDVVAFGILVLVLLVRPEGLMSGRRPDACEVAA